MRKLIIFVLPVILGLVFSFSNSKRAKPLKSSLREPPAPIHAPSNTTTYPLSVGEFPITTNPADQQAPAIWGDIVVWLDGRNGEWDVYGYDLSTQTEFAITTNPARQNSPAIWENIVVWAERRNGDSDGDIYGYDLSSQTEFTITADVADQWRPAIWGDIVVWIDNRKGSERDWDIYGYDLSAQTEFPITTNPARQQSPAIWGNTVVWGDERNGNYASHDIYGYDLSTQTEFAITTNPAHQSSPAILGDTVVWEDRRNGYGDIYGYNLSTKTEFPITTIPDHQDQPAIWGDIVVWENHWPPSIYGTDLSSGVNFRVLSDTPSSRFCGVHQGAPAISNNVMIWRDERSGNDDIYGLQFDVALNVEPSSLGFNPRWRGEAQAERKIEITQPLLGRGSLDWEIDSVTGWLNVTPTAGTTPSNMNVSIDDSNLPAGFYTGRIAIEGTNPSAAGSPQTVDVYRSVIKDDWTTFTALSSTRALAVAGDYLWVGGSGGVIRWDIRDGTYTKFTTADGLGRIEVSDIATDQAGTVWVGHRDGFDRVGVSRFDGNTWTKYSTDNSGLISNEVNTIAVDKNNDIWFGTEAGVSKLTISDNEEIWTSYTVENSGLAGNGVRAIAFAPDGDVWFGTGSAGVSIFDGNNWITYNTENSGLVYGVIQAIAIDDAGTAWIGTAGGCYPRVGCWGGLSEFDGATWATHLEHEDISTISIDSTGKIWTLAGGVKVFDGATWTTYDKSGAALVIDNNDKVWLAKPAWFSAFDGTTWKDYCVRSWQYSGPSRGNNHITAMTIDHSGKLLAASSGNDGGLFVYEGNTWHILRGAAGISAITTDQEGKIWIDNGEGLEVFDGSNWSRYTSDNSGLPDNWGIKDIAVDHDNNIWVHLGESGITRFDGTAWITFTEVISGYEPYGPLAVDTQGRVWAGHRRGISVFDGDAWTTYQLDEIDVPGEYVTAIATDHDGRIWFGTESGRAKGVTVYDGNTWTTYTTENSGLAGNGVLNIEVDRQNRLWFATSTFEGGRVAVGVSMFDGDTWKTYNTSNSGLASDGISAITFDCADNVWFGTGAGVSRLGTEALRVPFGDLNCDHRVNTMDVMKVTDHWGSSWGDSEYISLSDIDYDGDTDVLDVMHVVKAWSQ